MAAAPCATPDRARVTGLAAAVDRALAAGLDLRALEAVAQDDIDHTGKGFRSLCDHGAVTRYLDPLDGRQRNRVQVVVRLGDAPPIDEDRRAVSADGPQPDDLQAERPVKTEGIKVVAAFEEIPEVAHARQFDVGPVDHDDRVQIRCRLPRNKAGGGGKSIPRPGADIATARTAAANIERQCLQFTAVDMPQAFPR